MSHTVGPVPLRTRAVPRWPGSRFLLLLALGSLALAASYAALVLSTATWAEARALDLLYPFEGWHIRAFSPADWQRTQRGLGLLAAGLAAAWLALGPGTRRGRAELAATLAELRSVAARARRQWRGLAPGQRRWFWLHLALLTAVRLYLSLTIPWADDGGSYEYFVRQGLLSVSAYYPIPNNHVLANTIAWGFYQVHPGFWWAMRLPVLLTSTLGTGLMFGGLLRRVGYWPALLAAGAMGWAQLSLYHAAAGRGYWLLALLASVVFWAVLALADDSRQGAGTQRAAWLSLVGAGVLGSYAVPTFAYVLASAFSWLGLQAGLRRYWQRLGQLGAMGAAVGLSAALLYAPVLLVSGYKALLANPYVRALPADKFWARLPAHVWFLEGWLAGQRTAGAGLVLLTLALLGRLWQRARAGQLPPALARAMRQVGLPALWFVLWPYVLLLGQRVLPPERTWLYKTWFFYILVALVLAGWQWQRPARRWLLGLGIGLFISYSAASEVLNSYHLRAATADYRATYVWLTRHPSPPARPVLIPDLFLWVWLRFEAHTQAPTRPWLADQQPRPGQPYAYVLARQGSPAPLPAGTGAVVATFGQVRIYRFAAPGIPAH